MDKIIKELKENLATFIQMNKLQRQKAENIGKSNFLVLREEGDWVKPYLPDKGFEYDMRYRLRPDYAEEPEVVKCEVIVRNGVLGCKHRFGEDHHVALSYACSDPRFIGFLFNGDVSSDRQLSGSPRAYQNKETGEIVFDIHLPELHLYEVLTPTHVLFRGKK